MGGLDFLRRLRRDSRLERLPVGIVTGDYFLDEQSDRASYGALGATIRYKPRLDGRPGGADARPARRPTGLSDDTRPAFS